VHQAIRSQLVRSCHDLSEGGLAVGVAEMAFAGGWGASIDLHAAPAELDEVENATRIAALLFAESNTRFVCEVPEQHREAFEALMKRNQIPCGAVGVVESSDRLRLTVTGTGTSPRLLIDVPIAELKSAWQAPLRWQ
jgi:phosphoribosylformylglycinamidine synthase